MGKFKPFPYVFKYFNETRKKYWKRNSMQVMSQQQQQQEQPDGNSDLQESLCWFLS